MKTSRILGLGAAGAIGAGLGCAALIGLDPADPPTACTDTMDQTMLGNRQTNFVDDVLGCAVSTPGDPSAASTCIQGKDGVSKGCADCFAVNGACASQNCNMPCLNGTGSSECQGCIASSCNASLIACAGMPIYGCVDLADGMALAQNAAHFEMDVKLCGLGYTSNEAAVVACIQKMDGLSQPCALCYTQTGLCVVNLCPMCIKDQTTTMCATCVANDCTPVFTLCSGIAADAGP